MYACTYIYYYVYTHVSNHVRICIQGTCNGCDMGMGDLPDVYTWGLRATGLRDEGIHISTFTPQTKHSTVVAVADPDF